MSEKNDRLDDDIGEKIIDGRTGEEKIILLSEEGPDNDIRRSVILNEAGEPEVVQRYGSNKAGVQ